MYRLHNSAETYTVTVLGGTQTLDVLNNWTCSVLTIQPTVFLSDIGPEGRMANICVKTARET